jgi:hypothetical protein
MQTEVQHGQGVPLSFFEYGQDIGAAREHQGSCVVQHVEEVDGGWHQTAQDHHQHSLVLVHSLEQPVEITMVPVNRSPAMPNRKSVSCAAMLLAVAVALPCTNSSRILFPGTKSALCSGSGYVADGVF